MRTLAGTGSKAVNDYVGGRKGRAQQLNSPWDLALDDRVWHTMQIQAVMQVVPWVAGARPRLAHSDSLGIIDRFFVPFGGVSM